MTGATLLHASLLLQDLAGIAWSRFSIVAPLVVLAATPRPGRPGLWRVSPIVDPRPADGLALVALAPFMAFSLSGWTIAPDYVFHWGLKAQKFWLARGIDWSFLAAGWNWLVHPDYPNLLPDLYAATAIVRGTYRSTAALAWSPVLAGAAVLVAREWMRRRGFSPSAAAWGGVGLSAFLGFVGISFRRSGDADWAITLAILLGAALLTLPPSTRHATAIGLVAAFAAASKIEGIALAAFLIVLHVGRQVRHGAAWTWAGPARLLVPSLVVGLPWAWGVLRFELFLPTNTGALRFDHAGIVVSQMLRAALHPGWFGFGVPALVAVLALPWLRRHRAAALLLGTQLGFYAFSYLIAPIDATQLIAASFPRLLAHVAPAAFVLVAIQLSESMR